MLHAERRGGQPSVNSRWLWLETPTRGAGMNGLTSHEGLDARTAALDALKLLRRLLRNQPVVSLS